MNVRTLLHKLCQRSGFAPLDQFVEIRLTVFGIGLQQQLIDAQHSFNTGLILCQSIALPVRVLEYERGLRQHHRSEKSLTVLLIALRHPVEYRAEVYLHVGNLHRPLHNPLNLRLKVGIKRVGLEVSDVFERLLPFLGCRWPAIGGG